MVNIVLCTENICVNCCRENRHSDSNNQKAFLLQFHLRGALDGSRMIPKTHLKKNDFALADFYDKPQYPTISNPRLEEF